MKFYWPDGPGRDLWRPRGLPEWVDSTVEAIHVIRGRYPTQWSDAGARVARAAQLVDRDWHSAAELTSMPSAPIGARALDIHSISDTDCELVESQWVEGVPVHAALAAEVEFFDGVWHWPPGVALAAPQGRIPTAPDLHEPAPAPRVVQIEDWPLVVRSVDAALFAIECDDRKDEGCQDAGGCHGCLKWCAWCGDVSTLCDAPWDGRSCDAHERGPAYERPRS